jgi:hypothetical protein
MCFGGQTVQKIVLCSLLQCLGDLILHTKSLFPTCFETPFWELCNLLHLKSWTHNDWLLKNMLNLTCLSVVRAVVIFKMYWQGLNCKHLICFLLSSITFIFPSLIYFPTVHDTQKWSEDFLHTNGWWQWMIVFIDWLYALCFIIEIWNLTDTSLMYNKFIFHKFLAARR